MKSNLVKKILETAIVSSSLFGNLPDLHAPDIPKEMEETIQSYCEKQRESAINYLSYNQNSQAITPPNFKLPPSRCSKYMRKSAKSLFGKEYVPADAWDLQYNNKEVHQIKENENMEDLIIKGVLKPGMVIGAKWPVKDIRKYGNKGKDIKGKPIEYTHVVGYLGFNKDKEPEFLHQWGSKKEKATQKELEEKYKIEFVEILDSP